MDAQGGGRRIDRGPWGRTGYWFDNAAMALVFGLVPIGILYLVPSE